MLKKIEEMRGAGLTYSQIRRQITGCPAVVPNPIIHFPSSYPLSHYHYPLSGQLSSLAFLTVGLLLGYLLFMVNYQPKLAAPETAPTAAAMSAAPDTVALPGETWRQQTIRAISLTDNAETDEAVYLLTVPGRHLYKLGKTDVNFIK
jgi:hypothetical protein